MSQAQIIPFQHRNAPMVLARFKTGEPDSLPSRWPVKHPYWHSGYSGDCCLVVAYADDEEEILRNWPHAFDIHLEAAYRYEFTDQFVKPSWF